MQAQTQVEVQLTMSHEEAMWLRKVMQNPLHDIGEPERAIDAENRRSFYEALNAALSILPAIPKKA